MRKIDRIISAQTVISAQDAEITVNILRKNMLFA